MAMVFRHLGSSAVLQHSSAGRPPHVLKQANLKSGYGFAAKADFRKCTIGGHTVDIGARQLCSCLKASKGSSMFQLAHDVKTDLNRQLVESYLIKEGAVSDICRDTQKMINNPDYSDVVFLCMDGVRVYGCRHFLAARNEILQGMFVNGMAESCLLEVPLPEISSAQLLYVLNYLYAGRQSKREPQHWGDASEMILGATFFSVKELEVLLFDYLVTEAEKVKKDMEAVCKLLSVLAEYVYLPGCTIQIISRYLIQFLLFAPLKPVHLQHLSHKALLYFLEETASASDYPVLTTTEFLRFKTIVIWCACQQLAPDHPRPFKTVPEEIACVLKLLEKPREKQEAPVLTTEQQEMYSRIKSTLATSVRQHLMFLNFRHFSPDDLTHIVVPMDLVPASDVTSALEFRNSSPPVQSEEQTLGWTTVAGNRVLYKIPHKIFFGNEMPKDPSRVQQHNEGNGFAKYKLHIDRDAGGIHEWEIIIEEVCKGFIEVGLLCGTDLPSPSDFQFYQNRLPEPDEVYFYLKPRSSRNLSEIHAGYAVCMNHQGIKFLKGDSNRAPYRGISIEESWHDRVAKDCKHTDYGTQYAHKNSKVKFTLDMLKGTCSVCVDKKDFGVVWTELSDATYFPAVSLGNGPTGAVRIRVLRAGDRVFT